MAAPAHHCQACLQLAGQHRLPRPTTRSTSWRSCRPSRRGP